MDIPVTIKRIPDESGRLPDLPAYQTDGAAAMDLAYFGTARVELAPGERALLPTGLAAAVPPGWAALLFARSGLAVKGGLALANGVGVIDSDYRGEIRVGLVNLGDRPQVIEPGTRIAQLMLIQTPHIRLEEAGDLPETGRGAGGFGSTGKL